MEGGENLRVQFEFDMKKLPLAYRLGTLSIIKEMIRNGSEQYFHKIFVKDKRKLKPFGFSTFISNLEIKTNTIYGDRFLLTVSSPSYEFMMHLANGSERGKKYQYKDYSLTLLQKRLLPDPPEFNDVVLFKTLSPLLIENKRQKPLFAKDPMFEKEFNYYANLLCQEFFNRNLYQPVEIQRLKMRKTVVKEYIHQKHKDYLFFTGNEGLIQIKGDKRDLRAIYDYGIGLRRSLGFGLLDVEEVGYKDGEIES